MEFIGFTAGLRKLKKHKGGKSDPILDESSDEEDDGYVHFNPVMPKIKKEEEDSNNNDNESDDDEN